MTATGHGAGTVTVGQYDENPGGSVSFRSAGQFFDVRADGFDSLTITRCELAGGSTLEYWDPGAGEWRPVVGSAYPPAPEGCIAVTLDGSSTPGIDELGGTVFAVAKVASVRTAGRNRLLTAIAVSQESFPTADSAGAVVLARSDAFADALAGTPLAVTRNAPTLLTRTDRLDPATRAELLRVLPDGGRVYLLGGPAALSAGVARAVSGAGLKVTRLSGRDRYATAVAVARALDGPDTVFLATGQDFADGLSAGVAAAERHAAVLFTAGGRIPEATAAYLDAHPGERFAVGGPAARVAPEATAFAGADRYDTAARVAQAFFPAMTGVGLAGGTDFPDALTAGPALARAHSPLLLTKPRTLPGETARFLRDRRAAIHQLVVYGGPGAVDDAVVADAVRAAGPGSPTTAPGSRAGGSRSR